MQFPVLQFHPGDSHETLNLVIDCTTYDAGMAEAQRLANQSHGDRVAYAVHPLYGPLFAVPEAEGAAPVTVANLAAGTETTTTLREYVEANQDRPKVALRLLFAAPGEPVYFCQNDEPVAVTRH